MHRIPLIALILLIRVLRDVVIELRRIDGQLRELLGTRLHHLLLLLLLVYNFLFESGLIREEQ
jgi:hypothetical protein